MRSRSRHLWWLAAFGALGVLLLAGLGVRAAGRGRDRCPCTLFGPAVAPGGTASSAGPRTVGVGFLARESGFVTGLRFFRLPGTHQPLVAGLWTSGGRRLASGEVEEPTRHGWQELHLGAPVRVVAGRTYVVAYTFGGGPVPLWEQRSRGSRGPLLQTGSVESRAGPDTFPGRPGPGPTYLVDVVFDRRDREPPYAVERSPAPVSSRVSPADVVRVVFSEPVRPRSVRIVLKDDRQRPVAGRVEVASDARSATFRPAGPLAAATTYTVRVDGATDGAGNTAAVDEWRFTTARAPGPAPILVVRPPGPSFAGVYPELLRAEGLPAAEVISLDVLERRSLEGRAVVILPPTGLAEPVRDVLEGWVRQGGRLLAVRPAAALGPLVGMRSTGRSLADGDFLVDTSRPPGAGITSEPLRYHGPADLWEPSGADVVATLRIGAGASRYPAVTIARVGAGRVAAFTYDLARSVVLTRQGNPDWAGDNRDGDLLVRSDDLFFGAAAKDPAPDWVDLDQAMVRQADEQQRLFANVLGALTDDTAPLPRFWYLPRGLRAAVVMTGDDHDHGGTVERFRQYEALSRRGCSVADWECVRATSYVYAGTLPAGTARRFAAEGFEVAAHLARGCSDWTRASLDAAYRSELDGWRRSFPGLESPVTNRNHCVTWSDFTGAPEVERRHGIRLDTSYYYYPPTWVKDRPGWFTGSALPMRFVTATGRVLDVYQVPTQINDEADLTLPWHAEALLDQLTGPGGAAGVVTVNMHTDFPASAGSDAVVRAAMARHVPVISAGQLLDWLDARNGSAIDAVSFDGTTLRFAVTAATGARGLELMVPRSSVGRVASTVLQDGAPIEVSTRVLAGRSWLVVPARAGSYEVAYRPGASMPVIDRARTTRLVDGTVRVEWETDAPTTGAVVDTDGAVLATQPSLTTRHSIVLAGLVPGREYRLRVQSVDAAGNRVEHTLPVVRAGLPALVAKPVSGFAGGTADKMSVRPDGLALAARVDVQGGGLPHGWLRRGVASPPARTALDGGSIESPNTVGWDRSLEFDATFSGPSQWLGAGSQGFSTSIGFTTGTSGRRLEAVVVGSGRRTRVPLAGDWLGRPHRFQIDTGGGRVTFWIDGLTVAQVKTRRLAEQPIVLADRDRDGRALDVSGVRVTPYASEGTYTSLVLDAGATVTWRRVAWDAVLPVRSRLRVEVRTGSTPRPDSAWSPWIRLPAADAEVGRRARYLQFRVTLGSDAPRRTPRLSAIWFERVP